MTDGVEIELRGVCLRRGGVPVLDGVDLEIRSGETVALVGRSGTGKSSLLKVINGLLRPDSGSVRIHGKSVDEWNPYDLRRRLGYVLQEVALFPHLTIGQNVGIVPRLLNWDPTRIARRTDDLLDLVGLPPGTFAARTPAELSGGQRQRVGVARALAGDPPILLMDEPFGALDPITRGEIQGEFRRIQARLRKAVLLVTHDMGEALTLGTRVGVLAEGRLIACDAPDRIAAHSDPHVRALLQPLRDATAALGASR
ncbi:MAG TPA: ATP-binding cassette domain-containing protein [Vicinamibacterales bacterium]|nr:ATP-binding cassette domain-containing protein [Vicinamibacterales bacterium]